MGAEPGCCPTNFYNIMLSLLKRYIRLLTVLFGPRCVHLSEVQEGVYHGLSEKVAVYESLSGALIAEILWQVFIDARDYFSYIGPGLPESQLFPLRLSIRTCALKATINCPVALLLNTPPVPAPVSLSSRSGQSRGSGSSRTASFASMSTLSSPMSSAADRGAPLVAGKRLNPNPIPEIVSIMQDFRTQRPGVDMYTLMRSEKLLMADVGIGGRGACMDFIYFGECPKAPCPYTHDPANVSPGKRRNCVKKMTKAVAGYLLNNPEG